MQCYSIPRCTGVASSFQGSYKGKFQMTTRDVDQKAREDAAALLGVKEQELIEAAKTYNRMENNARVFFERTNHELAAFVLYLNQLQQNVQTLRAMAGGYFVEPKPPITAQPAPVEKPAEEPKANGTHTPAKAASDAETAP